MAVTLLVVRERSLAQISPPGLGVAHTVNWVALGFRQKLKTRKPWQSMTYVGMGRMSDPNNYDPVSKPAIFVLNEEITHTINKHYQYSFALSYRHQDEYVSAKPYEHQSPGFRQEFRPYGRFYYTLPMNRFKLAAIFRQEFMRFYTPDFKNPEEDMEIRSRYRLQLSMALNKLKTQKISLNAEALFSSSHESEDKQWTPYRYGESRFSCYYSYTMSRLPVTLDVGYMNNLLGRVHPIMVHYFAFDVILDDVI